MATTPLRGDPFTVDSNLAPQQLEALDVSSMNSLSRGWTAGRIGNDANALSAEELQLRASGDVAGADALRQQIKGLDLRRGAYAPAVGRVEDVHGLGDVGSYIAGQVGQGAASMVDPMAVSAGLATAGRFLPGVAGRVAQGAALGVPYLMNQRQLTGEFGNAAYQDPELIARTSPTQLRDDANLYGAGAAVLDTALPGIVGRQVSGLSRAGGAMARKSVMGAGTKAVVGMGMEGATETAQSMGSQYTLGQLNPNRDTSGDFSENLNSFVGGAVGAGPFAAAGAYAEAGHNRVGAGVDRVKDAAGTVIDMANGSETVQKAKGMFGKAKDGVIDLAKNDDGAASASALLDNLKAGAQDLKSRGETSLEELSMLRNTPPDDVLADETNAKLKAWDAENAPKRAELIASKLQGMKDSPEAAGLLEGLAEPDDGVYAQNLEKAAQFLIAEHPVGRVNERAATLGENLGKIAGVAGPAIGRGAVAVGKGVAGFAKAVLSGAKDEASKKNAQAAEESFGEWRDRNYGVRGQEAADSALKEGASYNKAVEFSQRAELAGSYASDMAQRGKGGMKYAQLAKHLAYTVANMLDTDAAKLDVKSRMVRLNRLTTDFHDIYRDAAPEVLTQLGVILGPQASPAVKHMIQQLEAQMSPGGRQAVVSERDQLARRVVGLISPKAQNALMQQGVNINTPGGREKVLGIMEDFADKISSTPHAREALDGLLGADSVRSVMELLNGQAEPEAAEVIDDRSEIGDVEKEQAEKLVVKGSGAKIYAYGNGAGLRSSDERRDPFAASEKADVETGVVKRPAMFTKGQKLFGGADAIEKKMADLKKQLASDPAYPDHDNYRIESKSAWDVIQDNKMQPGKVLQLYRDYMRADAADEKLSEGQRKYAAQQGKLAHSMILDSLSKQDADKSLKKHEFKTGPRERSELTKAAEAYFKERFVVVAEQISNRDPEKVTATEALALFQDGRRKLSAVRRDSQDLSEADQNLATSEANILYFTGKDEKGKPATVPVQAGKLVHFVRKQQGQSSRMDAEESGKSFSNATKDAEFLTDLMTGIGMMIDSGHATGMPYMLNRFGKAESFTQGVPKSLMLATQTAGAKEFGAEKRREKPPSKLPTLRKEDVAQREEARYSVVAAKHKLEAVMADSAATDVDREVARFDLGEATRALDDYQAAGGEEVADDQNRNDEFFTPEDRAERDLQESPWAANKRVSGKADTSTAARSKSVDTSLVTRQGKDGYDGQRGTSTNLRVDVSGTVAHEPKFSGDSAGPEWDPKSTELDFSKGQDSQAADDDETTDVLKRTKLGGKSAYSTDIGPEPKGKAADAAVHRAAAIGAAWNRSEAEGMAMIEMRFRMATAPAYSENKNEAVGGPHYIAPVAAFVNATNLAGMDLGPKELKEFSSIRARVAQVLMGEGVSKTERVKLARLMSTDPAKVTSMNVDGMLGVLASRAVEAPAAGYVSPARPAAPMKDVSRKSIKGTFTTPASQKVADSIGPLFDGLPPAPINDARTAGAGVPVRMPQKIDNSPRAGNFPPRPLLQGGAAAPLGKPSGGRKLNAQTSGEGSRFDVGNQLAGDSEWAAERLRDAGNETEARKLEAAVAKATGRRSDPATGELLEDGLKPLDVPYARAIAQRYGLHNALNALEEYDRDFARQNAQQGPARVASQADMDEAKAYVTKVLGPRIKVEFKNLTGYSGEFIDAKNVIEISTTAAAGTMGTTWHEAMHVFFRDFVKGNPGMIKTFEGLVNDPKHLAKLHALLSGFPAAQAQLHSGEERLAYTYQFWKAGLLQVDAEAKTWLQKIGKFFRRVMGMVRDSERALELFTAFDKGAMQDPSAAAQVIEKALGKGQWTLRQRQKLDALVQGVAAMTMPSAEVLEISVSAKARKLSRMLFTNPGEGESGSDEEGYLNARRRMATKYNNMFAQAIGDLNEGDQNIVQGYLQKETELSDIAYEPHRAAVKSIRSLLQRFHQYMTESGMEIGHAGDNYYPVVWSLDALLSNKAEFVEMLVTKYASNLDPLNGDIQKAAERVYEALINKDGVDAHIPASREDGVLAPFFASQNGRTLPWLAAVDREKYMQKNMIGTLSRYFHQGARSTEYFRRFGQDGVKLDAMLYGTKSWNPATKSEDRATDGIYHELLAASKEKSGMTPEQQKAWLTRQMRDVTRSVSAMEGTLGKDVSPTMRKFSSWMNVYQNIRLLPLSLFSSFVDPLGLLARGGTFQESYDAFLSGMREVFAGWRDAFRDMPAERQKNEWERLAEFVGTVDAAMFSHHVADEYSSVYMSPAAKKINDKMFVLNGMEAWNRGMRVAATKSAVKFIERHALNADPAHSKRWLQELGLTAAQVYTDADGGLITDRHVLAQAHNMPLADATKKMEAIHYAINRWVEGAVLTPNAAQRPAWSSDPHYSMLFHLKQFSYSFHQTILKRAVAEMKHGNMAPMGAFIWYIPTMIAADITKGLIQGGGELPPYMKGYSAGDWLLHGYQRAGLSGIGVIGVDAAEDVASLGGPAVEQVIDGLRDPLERTAVNALPLHSVYAQMFRGATAIN